MGIAQHPRRKIASLDAHSNPSKKRRGSLLPMRRLRRRIRRSQWPTEIAKIQITQPIAAPTKYNK
jgi:hypothetical protein